MTSATTDCLKPVVEHADKEEPKNFLSLQFANKGLDAINLANILHHKSVKEKIPPYFNDKSVPKISYTYTTPIAPRIFNYKKVLQNLRIDDFKAKPPDCSCASSPFKYSPSGHVITGDLNIISNESLRNVLSKGPKYREPKSINWNFNFKLLMDAVEDYARKWNKREQDTEIDSLSEWVKAVRSLIQLRIKKLRRSMNANATSIFNNRDVAETLASIHNEYVVVPADKAPNNIVFICKKHYVECLIQELGIDGSDGNPTYTRSTFAKDEIIDNHMSVLSSFGISFPKEDCDLPSLYWIPKLHKDPYKQRFIAGSAKCSTKPLSVLLTSILTEVKDGLQKYCETSFSRSGVNDMWILKNSKELLESLRSKSLSTCNSIKTFDFSTLYTTIPHPQLKEKLKSLIHRCFSKKNGEKRFKYIVVGREMTYFVKHQVQNLKTNTPKKMSSKCSNF